MPSPLDRVRAGLRNLRAATPSTPTSPEIPSSPETPETSSSGAPERSDGGQDAAEEVVARVEDLLRDGGAEAVATAVALGRGTDALPTAALGPLAGRFLVTGHGELARDLVEESDRRGTDELNARQRRKLDHLRTWTHPTRPPEPPAGAVPLGVFYYRQPDRARGSSNIGDYVQTLSMMGNLVRFSDVELTGSDGLGELATDLQSRVRPELRLSSAPRRVHLVPVSRDFSVGDAVPEGTWLFAFGWHLHASFGLRYGLPYHPRLRPLFLSFHLHAIDALDEPTIDYLRAHGPIGCRDWTTVDLLLSAGVDAFFTGCVTTTVDAVFPPLDSIDRSGAHAIGVIDTPDPDDLPADQPVTHIENGSPRHRELTLVDGTRAAVEVLEDYQRRLDRVVTSRLHAYLPATSLGLEVDIRPKIPGDGRFAGLSGLRPASPELDAMRDGIRELVADALGRIIEGASREEVYDAWRARTAPLVEQARARHDAPPPPYPAVSTTETQSRLQQVPPREIPSGAARHGTLAVLSIGPEATAVDVLALPRLLPEIDRLVVVDHADDTPDADLARLAATELAGNPVAASLSTQASAWVWRRAAHRLPAGPAAELRRLMSARHPFATRAIEPGPVVLDLARMRADPALPECLTTAAHFGLDAREALLAYAGPRVTPVDRTT